MRCQTNCCSVVIYSGKERKQNFGQVRNAYVRLVDELQRPERCSFQPYRRRW
ncbi:MAG: TerD family protein [Streptococcus salivarius]